MEKINRNNYEAYFLDFAEGNLAASRIAELESFLEENPDLRSELDDFEIIEIPTASADVEGWGNLKKPDIKALHENAELRDSFFFKAVENVLSSFELKMLEELVEVPAFAKEYDLWKRIVLIADGSKMQKDSLYQFGLDQSITAFNYDYFLIARCEGLLSTEQNAELEKFAEARPNGIRELAIADNLKLKPAQGIFYPNKTELYHKEKKGIVIWLYRAAAIAAALLFGVFIWNQAVNEPIDRAPISKVEPATSLEKIAPGDSNKVENAIKRDSFPDTEVIEEPLLEDWEVREPEPVEYAESQPTSKTLEPADSEKTEIDYQEAEKIDPVEIDNFAENKIDTEIIIDSIPTIPDVQIDGHTETETLAEAKPKPKFKTVPELAEDLMAQKLNIPDSEKDEMAMVVAKRLTNRASELLDAEYSKKETGAEGDESLTYTLRIGSFQVMRSKNK